MKQQREIWAGLVVLTAFTAPVPLAGQVVLTSDAGAFNNYTWRGVTLTNKVVLQPDAYLTIPAGGGAAVFGAWGNIDAGRYDDPLKDLSEGGGTAGFDAPNPEVSTAAALTARGFPLSSQAEYARQRASSSDVATHSLSSRFRSASANVGSSSISGWPVFTESPSAT